MGRDEELERLDELCEGRHHRPLVVVLTGVGGVGKTALATTWLDRRRDHFPDGILYSSFVADDNESVDTILHGFLTSLGVATDDIPAQSGQRAALFRSVTLDCELAILLDDAVAASQVRPLLPASRTAVVVVTSRSRLGSLAVDGAEIVDVDPLPAAPARTLLSTRAGHGRLEADPSAVDALLELCAGLPLALTIAGARLRTRPGRSLTREVRSRTEVTSHPTDKTMLTAIFDESYNSMSAGAARLYRLCGLLPGPHQPIAALAHVREVAAHELDPEIDELLESNLMTELPDDVLTQHDVVRHDAHVRGERETTPAERTKITRAYTTWYLRRVLAADELIHPFRPRFARSTEPVEEVFPDRELALQWWRRDRAVIQAVIREGWHRGWDDVTWQLCEASWGFFLHHRDYEPFLATNAHGIEAAHRCGLPLVEARLRSQVGYALDQQKRYAEADAEHALALEIGQRENDGPTLATATSRLARAAKRRGDVDQALELYQRSAELHEALDLPRGVALARRRRGQLLAGVGRYAEAELELAAAADTMAAAGDANQYARAVTALAQMHDRGGFYGQAREQLLDALSIVRGLDSPHYTAEILRILADLETRQGDLEQANDHRAEADRISGETTALPDAGTDEASAEARSHPGDQ
ncbi:tetratricopeptide repeat protein [Amycolatopsis sp. NPDC047767]|uniref:tetratricopeptide repeat protein n=1 Tax=Amycolatopsis sp. NPDC047767 TaxID=3156765 RepID=UPI0034527859